MGENDELKWWETEPIAKLYLCSNKITTVSPAIAGLKSLTLLDLRDNMIEVGLRLLHVALNRMRNHKIGQIINVIYMPK